MGTPVTLLSKTYNYLDNGDKIFKNEVIEYIVSLDIAADPNVDCSGTDTIDSVDTDDPLKNPLKMMDFLTA